VQVGADALGAMRGAPPRRGPGELVQVRDGIVV
jgi:hypothetical protein